MQSLRLLPAAWCPRLLLLLFVSIGLAGCAAPKPNLVVTVGGLGFSQMHDLRMAIKDLCPDADVVSAGAWDAYKTDIVRIATERQYKRIILVGHSFGCEAIDRAARDLPRVDLAVFIDPAWDDFALSSKVGHHIWYKRSDIGFERVATIKGASRPKVIQGGHNDLPHSPELISEVVTAINDVGKQPEGIAALIRNLASGLKP
jgi:pimeloyl-ACP methyl ester carboxylesterase